MKTPIFLLFALVSTLSPSCAHREAPARGEPIRVGQVKNEELSLREIPLERYVAGVLEKEVHGTWPIEALKAQAVAARTYALYRKLNPRDTQFDVLSDTTDQVFESDEGHSPAIVRAVTETEGETLQYEGKVFQAFFHSCCGGRSESAAEVWPGRHPTPLLSVHDDPYCSKCPPAHWSYQIDRGEFESVEVSEREASGRAKTVSVATASEKPRPLSGIAFRQKVGNTRLKSTLFDVASDGTKITIEGRGAGHGVGLCQWGSKGMAEAGKDYREILDFYYPGADVVPVSAEVKISGAVEEKILQELEAPESQE